MSQQKEVGTLVVVVLKAQHLHQPSFYKQDPYAQVSLSGLKKRTKVDPKGGQHPVWDDELRFPVLADAGKDKVNRILEISCYKHEQRGDDILLGKGTVDIEETLKTGEFDDWVPLETSAGARGEVYLEMTFYANSPPVLTRRASKLNPHDRLARPAAYFKQGQLLTPTSASLSTSGRSSVPGEKKPSRPPPTGASQIPLSLIPAHGSQTKASKQAVPSSEGTTPAVTEKQKDLLPPLPADSVPADDDSSGKNLGLPASLQPGGRSGPRPMPPQNRNRVTSMGRPPPETLPNDLHRRALSDTPALAPPSSLLEAPAQVYSPEITPMTGSSVSSTPSIHVEEYPPIPLPTTFVRTSAPAQEHEPRGVYTAGDRDSFTYGSPGQGYVQPNSQGYFPAPAQGYQQTFSPSHRPVPLQSPYTPLGQPQQLYEAPPVTTSPVSVYPQYTQFSGGPPTPQPLPPPQTYYQPHGNQPQQQHTPYPPQPQYQPPLHQQPYLPPQQQQYLPPAQQQQQYPPQQPPYSQTPHPPNVPQSYQHPNHPGLAASPQPLVSPQPPQPPYSQTPQQPQQSYFAVPPPPPVQSQTPQPYTPQPPHQHPQSFIPPPPPPPPLHNQGGKGTSNPVSVAQPSQTSVLSSTPSQVPIPPPASLSPSVTPVTPSLQSPTTTPPASQAVLSTAPASTSEEVVGQKQAEEGKNESKPISVAGAGTELPEEEARVTPEDVATHEEQNSKIIEGERGQSLQDTEEQRAREERECRQRMEEEDRQRREEELRRQEELKRQQEEDRKRQEAERRRREEEEQRKREEEERQKREEEERRKREEEERRRREEEELKRREEEERRRREEEECRRREEEERRRRKEEERRMQEEERRRREEEGRRRREEEERRRREEEERRKKEEEEHRRQEEERIQHEREEAERRRKAAEEARRRRAEEAEAERKWKEELARIRARAEQEAADAAFARAQMEAEEEERRRQEEADLAFVRQVQEEAEREERLTQERRRQEEADMEVARREQAHEEDLERIKREETRRRMEEADRELARRLDRELNVGAEQRAPQGSGRQLE